MRTIRLCRKPSTITSQPHPQEITGCRAKLSVNFVRVPMVSLQRHVILQFGTLGDARRKIILFRRYGFLSDLAPVGVDVSHDWKDNDGDFAIENDSPSTRVWIEDLYEISGDSVPPSTKISTKFDAITRHMENANASANKTQPFVSFASGFGSGVGDNLTPKVSGSVIWTGAIFSTFLE